MSGVAPKRNRYSYATGLAIQFAVGNVKTAGSTCKDVSSTIRYSTKGGWNQQMSQLRKPALEILRVRKHPKRQGRSKEGFTLQARPQKSPRKSVEPSRRLLTNALTSHLRKPRQPIGGLLRFLWVLLTSSLLGKSDRLKMSNPIMIRRVLQSGPGLVCNPTSTPTSQTDSLTTAPPLSPSLSKSRPPKLASGSSASVTPGSSSSSTDSTVAPVHGAAPSNERPGTLVYVDLPPLQGPPVDTLEGLQDALAVLERDATAARRIVRSQQSRLTCIEGDILVIRHEIAAMKEKLKKGKGRAE